MKSRTSFCKLLRKDVTRFFPLWGGYCVILLLVILKATQQHIPVAPPGVYVTYVPGFNFSWKAVHMLSLPFAITCAVVLFGDLYDRQRAMVIYAFPFRRETLFCAHSLAGALFYLLPTGTCLLILKAPPEIFASLGLHFLLCYGLALLCAMLAGNRIGGVLMYFGIYFLPTVTEFLYSLLYQPWLPSMAIPDTGSFYDLQSLLIYNTPLNISSLSLSDFLPCGCLGIFLATGALVLHHFRKPERTGSFSVFSGLCYPFTAFLSFVAAMVLFLLLHHNRDQFYFLFLYIPIFYFGFAMAVEKRFFVFRAGHILSLCVLAALLFNSIWIVRYDAFGLLDYVPKAKQVRSVEVYVEESDVIGINTYYYDESLFSQEGRKVVAPEDIEKVTQVHQALLEHRDFSGESCMVYLTYRLKSGLTVRRYYPCPKAREEAAFDLLDQAVSTRASVFGNVAWEDYVNQVYAVAISRVRGDREFLFTTAKNVEGAAVGTVKILGAAHMRSFLDALKEDCDNGSLKQLSYDNYAVTVRSRDPWGREKQVRCIIPHLASSASYMLDMCWDAARVAPERTISDDTPLVYYDITFEPDGSIIRIPRTD